MNIYLESSYKQVLKLCLLEKKSQLPESFNFQKMAETCRIQKTYLSRVLNGSAHLNTDQLYSAMTFLNLNAEEKAFVQLLHEHERSILETRRRELQGEIRKIQAIHRKTEKHIQAPVKEATLEELGDYYLDPYCQLVHFFLTIPRYARDMSLIAEELDLSKKTLSELLAKLERIGMIAKKGKEYKVVNRDLHLSSQSNLVKPFCVLMKVPLLEKIQRLSLDEGYHFTVFFSTNERVRNQIQEDFLAFLKKAEKMVKADDRLEAVYQMCFDLLPWSR